MNEPVKYRGQFIVTTKGNKPVKTYCSREQAEYYLEMGRGRKLWQWINDSMHNRYGYVIVKSSRT